MKDETEPYALFGGRDPFAKLLRRSAPERSVLGGVCRN